MRNKKKDGHRRGGRLIVERFWLWLALRKALHHALNVVRGDQTTEDDGEARSFDARDDVLITVRVEKGRLDLCGGFVVERTTNGRDEVGRVGGGLGLEDSIDRANERDEVGDRFRTRRCVEFGVLGEPLELIEDRVLALLEPVEAKDILEERREVVVGGDALDVVRLPGGPSKTFSSALVPAKAR